MPVDYFDDDGEDIFHNLSVRVREWARGLPHKKWISLDNPRGISADEISGCSIFRRTVLLLEADNYPHLAVRLERWRSTFKDIGGKIDRYCEERELLYFSQDFKPIEAALGLDLHGEIKRFLAEVNEIADMVVPPENSVVV